MAGVYDLAFMDGLSEREHKQLINAIAIKEGNARYISNKYNRSVDWLKEFVKQHKEELEEAREALSIEDTELTPSQLGELWISNKNERLRRYQAIADELYKEAMDDPTDATVLREFRSYLAAVANELGQFLHRGSGEGNLDDTLGVEIEGVDMSKLWKESDK